MIYLDANIFIYAATNNGPKGENCRKLLLGVFTGKTAGYTSTLTWDEVIYAIWKKEGRDKAVKEGKRFIHLPNLNFLIPTQNVISHAQDLCGEFLLKPRDAIHAATAIIHKISKIASDDPDFDKVKELKRVRV